MTANNAIDAFGGKMEVGALTSDFEHPSIQASMMTNLGGSGISNLGNLAGFRFHKIFIHLRVASPNDSKS